MIRWIVRSVLMLLVLATLGATACSPAKLDVVLYYPSGDDGSEIYQKIAKFEVRFAGQALDDPSGAKTEISADTNGLALNDIACKKEESNLPFDLRVVGFDENDNIVGSGRQVIYQLCGKPRNIYLFFSPLEQFSTLSRFRPESNVTEPGRMERIRAGHRITYLPDGRLLITGGAIIDGPGNFSETTNHTEIFDPETGLFEDGPKMKNARAFHTATLVGSRIFIAGGLDVQDGNVVSVGSVEVFEVNEKNELVASEKTATLSEPRAFHTAIVTPNQGYVFLYGGVNWDAGKPTINTQWELFEADGTDIGKGQIKEADRRAWHGAVRLVDGKILVAGGATLESDKWKALNSTLFLEFSDDDSTIKVSSGDAMKVARVAPAMIRLNDDAGARVLISGGMETKETSIFEPSKVHNTMEVRAATGKFEETLTMKSARVFHSINQLEDGRVMLFGGFDGMTMASGAEVFLVGSSSEGLKKDSVSIAQRRDRFYHSAMVLNNGSLLVLGGVAVDEKGKYITLYRGEIFNPRPPPTE